VLSQYSMSEQEEGMFSAMMGFSVECSVLGVCYSLLNQIQVETLSLPNRKTTVQGVDEVYIRALIRTYVG